jgi:glutathione-specific gamma-glutamylcyclotransferase
LAPDRHIIGFTPRSFALHPEVRTTRHRLAGGPAIEHSMNDLWIFGYGSLMWRPGFAYAERVRARLTGYRRCFCIYTTNHRGTPARPGLVLGLDRGGVCDGVAYRVAAADARATAEYLRVREQVNGVYREAHLPVTLDGPTHREVLAQTYIVERAHPSYTGQLTVAAQAHLIRGARGKSGNNLDYLINTLEHLETLGIREPDLQRILSRIGPHFARCDSDGLASPRVAALLEVCRRLPCDAPVSRPGERRRFIHRRQIAVWHGG